MEEQGRRGNVITVFSTASAVGKTLVAINMAAELARLGYHVCLVDVDLQFGDVCNYLHLEPERTIADAQRMMEMNADAFDVSQFLDVYRCDAISFSVMASPLRLDEAYNMSTSAVQQILQQLQFRFDFVVVDTTSAFSETNLMIMDMSTIITFLGIVDFIPTIKNMKIGCDTIHSLGYDSAKIRLVLNRSNSKTKIDLEDVENILGEPFYHILSNDFRAAWDATMAGVPLVRTADTALARDLRALVARYTNLQVEDERVEDTGMSSWFKRIFN
ncbi:MAG: AAA family ATPase [Schwartzia sp.]|nr:AAA family ATPase [Schwartzia sp. (in: firmicutes)]